MAVGFYIHSHRSLTIQEPQVHEENEKAPVQEDPIEKSDRSETMTESNGAAMAVDSSESGRRRLPPDFKSQDDEAPSVEEFLASRPEDLNEVMKKSTSFRGLRTAWVGDMGPDIAGWIDIKGERLKIRYSIHPIFGTGKPEVDPRSCFSVRLPHREEIVGSVSDHTLEVRQARLRTSYIFIVNGTHYFFTFNCRSTTQPCDRFPGVIMLYYLKRPDGKIAYQGQVQWTTYGDPTYRELSRCRFMHQNG